MLPPTPPNFILFQLDFDVKFPLLRPLLFLNVLKSIIFLKVLRLTKNEIQLLELLSLLFYISFIFFKFILVELGTLKKTLENALF